jgi:hypothetical protein
MLELNSSIIFELTPIESALFRSIHSTTVFKLEFLRFQHPDLDFRQVVLRRLLHTFFSQDTIKIQIVCFVLHS